MITIELTGEEHIALKHAVTARAEYIDERIRAASELGAIADQAGNLKRAGEIRDTRQYWLRQRDQLAPILHKVGAAR